jgi:hypothetical protein
MAVVIAGAVIGKGHPTRKVGTPMLPDRKYVVPVKGLRHPSVSTPPMNGVGVVTET